MQKLLRYYRKDIRRFFPEFILESKRNQIVLTVFRNMNLAGLFVGQKNGDQLQVELDYVVPQYRDYKNGAFIFEHFREVMKTKQYSAITAHSDVPHQMNYLKKMGFVADGSVDGIPCFKLVL